MTPWQNMFSDEYESLRKNDEKLAERFSKLCDTIQGHKNALLAFSGGTDSALLAFLGSRLMDRCLCVIADSPTISRNELAEAEAFASDHELELRIVRHNILEEPEFRANNAKRCYHCKTGLLKLLGRIMKEENLETLFEGSNLDDLDDYRPGRLAVAENRAASPLLEAGLGKMDVRSISKILGLSTWDKPQMACLASRFPRGTEITESLLARIERAEELVRGLGYRDVRVRYHGDIARIELGRDEKINLDGIRGIIPDIKKLEFRYVVLDMEGYRTGSLNEQSQ